MGFSNVIKTNFKKKSRSKMASRILSTEEVLSFIVDDDDFDDDTDPNEPIADGSDEEFECIEDTEEVESIEGNELEYYKSIY